MKVAPVTRALAARQGVRQTLVHTGQHYDQNMSDVFFRELEISEPDFNLAVGSGTHAEQTGQIMLRFEPVVVDQKPDRVLVYGDVNSTIAAALVCAKLQIPVAHVEAGLRSFDRTMPEEINRLLTDQLADLLFTPSPDGDRNLLREGVTAGAHSLRRECYDRHSGAPAAEGCCHTAGGVARALRPGDVAPPLECG